MLAKDIHIASVVLTFVLFFVRGIWMMVDSELLQRKWTRLVPPLIDTTLLISAIVLAITIRQYPFVHGWLTAKVMALLFYIALGMLALTYGSSKQVRVVSWLGAQLCFLYIVGVALTKNPLLFL